MGPAETLSAATCHRGVRPRQLRGHLRDRQCLLHALKARRQGGLVEVQPELAAPAVEPAVRLTAGPPAVAAHGHGPRPPPRPNPASGPRSHLRSEPETAPNALHARPSARDSAAAPRGADAQAPASPSTPDAVATGPPP